MPFLIKPHMYPHRLYTYKTGEVLTENFSNMAFFGRLARKQNLSPIKDAAQLDELPADINLLAFFHGEEPKQNINPIALFTTLGLSICCIVLVFSPSLISAAISDIQAAFVVFLRENVGIANTDISSALFYILIIFIAYPLNRLLLLAMGETEGSKVSQFAKRWHKQGGMRLGMGWMIVDKPEYTYGDTIRFIYHQKAVKPTRLMSGLVRLVLIEATEAGFASSPTYNHEAIEISRFEIPAGSYKPDEAIRVRGELTLPTYAPSVLIASDNRMAYMLEVKLEVADQPTRELLYHLPIEPAVENEVVRTNEALDQMSQNILRRLL